MADNVTLPGTGVQVASDEIAGIQHQYLKLELGADGVATKIEPGQQLMAASVPVTMASNQTPIPVSDNAGSLSVDDNAGSLTVDSPQLPAALGAGGGVKVDGSGTALPISAAALPLPAGAATQATLALVATEATVATLATEAAMVIANAHLADIEAAVEILDDAIAGTEMQVDIVSSATVPARLVTNTTGGATAYRNLDVDENGVVVKGAPGQLYGYHVINQAAAARYVKIYNKATAPTNADTPLMTIAMAATSNATLDASNGIAFTAGIGLRATTALADADVGAPAGNDVVVNLFYA